MLTAPIIAQWDGSAEGLRARLSYDCDTGVFVWREKDAGTKDSRRWNRRYAGNVAGSPNSDGYISIKLNSKLWSAHRLAWLYVYGTNPLGEIDHVNGHRSDNRIANLREATRSQQMWNRTPGKPSKCGLRGVSRSGPNRFRATISLGSKMKHLGSFATAEAAHEAYRKAAIQHRGAFARPS